MSTKGVQRGIPSPEPKPFGRVLKQLRHARGKQWTQEYLSLQSTVSRKVIAEYESGKGSKTERLTHDVVKKIAKAFGMSTDDLEALIEAERANPHDRLGAVEARVEILGKAVDGLLARAEAIPSQSRRNAAPHAPHDTTQQKIDRHA